MSSTKYFQKYWQHLVSKIRFSFLFSFTFPPLLPSSSCSFLIPASPLLFVLLLSHSCFSSSAGNSVHRHCFSSSAAEALMSGLALVWFVRFQWLGFALFEFRCLAWLCVEVDEDKISVFDTGPGMDGSDEKSIVKWGKMGASVHRSTKKLAVGGKPPFLTVFA
ncbi:uncharacterized protein [Spinacia oleracea]|uniref:Uncharacterized protein isoform X1 n=1 Tax=Spinacia oleracea TaxID=3562 RepID=A0ABM3R176_SPIOL|nr:uncharacterized protein LOC110802765 isoform X1 [Spinacia oleracea]